MKFKRILSMVLSIAMVLGTVSLSVFANEDQVSGTLPTAVDGVITLTEDVALNNTAVIENVKINLNGKTLTLVGSAYLEVKGECEIYGGYIKTAEGYNTSDGLIRVGYYTDAAVNLKLTGVNILVDAAKVSTGVFCINEASQISIIDSYVKAYGTQEDDIIGVFYAGGGLCGDIKIQNSTIDAKKANAVFYRVSINIEGSEIKVDDCYKPVFRGAEGIVKDASVTVTGQLGSDNRALIEALDADVLKFEGTTTVTTDAATPFIKQSDVENHTITVIATPTVSLPEGAADVVETPDASIGDSYYLSLADAVAAAEKGDIITLVEDATGNGVVVPSGSNITIDLNGYTYNIDGETVGSTGTKTNGFQLLKNSDITIKNGTITSDKAKILIQNYSNLTLENVTLDGSNLVGTAPYTLSNNFGNTEITGNTNIIAKNGGVAFDCYYWPSNGYGDGVTVTLGTDFTGKINGKIEMDNDRTEPENAASKQSISISGGYFTTNVNDFCAAGFGVVSSDESGYTYKVAEIVKDDSTADSSVQDAAPSVDVSDVKDELGADFESFVGNLENAAEHLNTISALTGAATIIANDSNIVGSKEDAENALGTLANGKEEDVNVVIQPYIEIKTTAADTTSENKTIAYEIKAMYKKIATTATGDQEIITEEGDGQNAVVMTTEPMAMEGKEIEIKLPVPFANQGDTVYIKHTKDSGEVFVYTAEVNGGFIVFTNKNGFSKFEITTEEISEEAVVVAKINDVGYASFAAAVDAANDNDTIIIKKNGELKATPSKSKTFTVQNDTGVDITVEVGSREYTIATNESQEVKYKKVIPTGTPGIGSSGGGGTTPSAYTVKFETNGGNDIENQSVSKNETAKKPEDPTKEGYIFDGWYTDEELTTAYDFSTKVTKNLTLYAKWTESEDDTEEPETTFAFNDVKVTDWYYENVKYVVENNLMNGLSEDEFAPNYTLTRAMLVTVLYRNAGEPAVNKSIPFADIDMDSWYANAVIWAQQNSIVNGITENEFAPNNNITREQIAAIMYRYAQYKGYDVSVAENTNILSFDDFQDISEYAVASVQYAVGSGLINGKTETTLNPKDNATRAEIAAILQRFIEGNK